MWQGEIKSLLKKKQAQRLFASMLLSAFANGRYYGGGMLPAPNAEPDDGYLDVCLIKAINRLKIFRFFPLFMKGNHLSMSEVTTYRCRTVRMESPEPVHINADGELFVSDKLTITLIEKGLKFIKPL